MAWALNYTAPAWVGKPDPHGIGRCTQVYLDYDAAQEKAMKLQMKGAKNIRIDKIV